jgi:hypothetical protein
LPMVFKTWVFGWGIAPCRLICSELWFLLFVGNFSDIPDQSLLDKFDGKTLWRISPRRRTLGCSARGRSAYVYMFLHCHRKRVDDMQAWKFLFLYSSWVLLRLGNTPGTHGLRWLSLGESSWSGTSPTTYTSHILSWNALAASCKEDKLMILSRTKWEEKEI